MFRNPIPRNTPLERHIRELIGSDEGLFEALAAADPTDGSYALWIIREIRKGRITEEDLEKTRENLEMFDDLKRRGILKGQDRDVMRLTEPQLYRLISRYTAKKTFGFSPNDVGAVVYEDEKYLIYKTEDFNTGLRMSQGTNWCTRFPKYLRDYLEDGPLFFIFQWDGQSYNHAFLVHFESEQLKDPANAPKSAPNRGVYDFLESVNPGVGDFYAPELSIKTPEGEMIIWKLSEVELVVPKYNFHERFRLMPQSARLLKLSTEYGEFYAVSEKEVSGWIEEAGENDGSLDYWVVKYQYHDSEDGDFEEGEEEELPQTGFITNVDITDDPDMDGIYVLYNEYSRQLDSADNLEEIDSLLMGYLQYEREERIDEDLLKKLLKIEKYLYEMNKKAEKPLELLSDGDQLYEMIEAELDDMSGAQDIRPSEFGHDTLIPAEIVEKRG